MGISFKELFNSIYLVVSVGCVSTRIIGDTSSERDLLAMVADVKYISLNLA